MVYHASTIIDPATPSTLAIATAFFAAACYSSLETLIQIFQTFKDFRGLYFWSMQVATWGIITYVIFSMISIFDLMPIIISRVFTWIAYFCMNIAPLFVLYSRLHFVIQESRRIRWILFVIFATAIPLFTATMVFSMGSYRQKPGYLHSLSICLRVQVTCFSVTEIFISGLYVWAAFSSLKPIVAIKGKPGKKLLIHLVVVYVVLIVLLAIVLILNYAYFYYVALGFTPFVYSVKLRIEFAIITRLVVLVTSSPCTPQQLPQWTSSQNSLMVPFEPRLSTANPTPSESGSPGECTPGQDSTLDLRETEQEQSIQRPSIRGSDIHLPMPPKALPSDQLLGPDRVWLSCFVERALERFAIPRHYSWVYI